MLEKKICRQCSGDFSRQAPVHKSRPSWQLKQPIQNQLTLEGKNLKKRHNAGLVSEKSR